MYPWRVAVALVGGKKFILSPSARLSPSLPVSPVATAGVVALQVLRVTNRLYDAQTRARDGAEPPLAACLAPRVLPPDDVLRGEMRGRVAG